MPRLQFSLRAAMLGMLLAGFVAWAGRAAWETQRVQAKVAALQEEFGLARLDETLELECGPRRLLVFGPEPIMFHAIHGYTVILLGPRGDVLQVIRDRTERAIEHVSMRREGASISLVLETMSRVTCSVFTYPLSQTGTIREPTVKHQCAIPPELIEIAEPLTITDWSLEDVPVPVRGGIGGRRHHGF